MNCTDQSTGAESLSSLKWATHSKASSNEDCAMNTEWQRATTTAVWQKGRVQQMHDGKNFRRNDEGVETENSETLILVSFLYNPTPNDLNFSLKVFSHRTRV